MTALRSGLVLALYPNMSGLCYAVFEGKLKIVDWGIKTARKAKGSALELHAQLLMEIFGPVSIILPTRRAVTRGSGRLQMVIANSEKSAKEYGISVYFYSRADIQEYFTRYGARSKDAIARVIVDLLPEFAQHLPPPRKAWMSEDYRMGLFDAVALAMVYFETDGLRGQR
jgi:hypothetical protein